MQSDDRRLIPLDTFAGVQDLEGKIDIVDGADGNPQVIATGRSTAGHKVEWMRPGAASEAEQRVVLRFLDALSVEYGPRITRAIAGELVKEHQTYLYRFVLRNIGNPSDAEDIAQQAFIEAYKAMATFRGESKLSTWLYGIAMNLVRNYLNRAPHRVRQYESDDVLEGLADTADGPEALAERSQMIERLSSQISELSSELQQILMLVAVDGLSYDEAAVMLEIPVGTVRSRLFRAREQIKERLPDLRDDLAR